MTMQSKLRPIGQKNSQENSNENSKENSKNSGKKIGILGKAGLSALLLLTGAAGCGQTSFFEVAVVVNSNAGVRQDCLSFIDLCQVTVSGAASDSFTLNSATCVQPRSFQIGIFQYGTDSESGNVSFHVDIFDGNLKKLGQGDGTGAIKAGGRQPVTVPIAPDAVAFAPACPP
jgi:hypothetical protein